MLEFAKSLRRRYLRRFPNWSRVVMNRETGKLVQQLGPERLDVLEISGGTWRNRESFRSYTRTDYPAYDVCKGPLQEAGFDLVIAEQVFEHLLWPYRAGRNVLNMLRPEGHFLITTPFMLRVHHYPQDCTRWTETGIRYFLAECGFPIGSIVTGSWGNLQCVKANAKRWAKFYSRHLHSLHNDPAHPVVVWALARR